VLFIVPGALLAIVGCGLFAFIETTDNYSYIHSSWHIMMASAVMLVLPPRTKEKRESQESLLLGTLRNSPCSPSSTSTPQCCTCNASDPALSEGIDNVAVSIESIDQDNEMTHPVINY
jgi:hypothetical protein